MVERHGEIEEEHGRLVDLYDFAPVAYVTLDATGTITRANLTAATLLGVERPNLVGQPFARQVERADADRWERLLRDATRTQGKGSCVLSLRRSDGASFHGQVSWESRQASAGAPSLRIAITDISDLIEAGERLKMRESLLDAILDGTADGILIVGDSGKVLLANTRFQEIWRLPDDVIASQEDGKFLGYVMDQLADPDAFLQEVRRLYLCEEQSVDNVLLADGRVLERFTRPFTFDGPRGRLWSFRDITEQRKAESALRESEKRFRTLADSAPVGIFQTDANGQSVYQNPVANEVVGMNMEKARGLGWQASIAPEDGKPSLGGGRKPSRPDGPSRPRPR